MVEVNYTDPDEFPLPRIPNFNAVARAVLQAYRNTLIQIYTDEIIPARQGETSLQDLTGNIPTLLTDVGVLQTTVAGLSAGSGLIVVAGEPVTTLDTGLTVVGDISKEVVGNVGSKRLQLTVNFPQKLSIQNLGQQATDQTIDATSENGWVRVEPTSNLTINFTDVQEGTIFQTEIKGGGDHTIVFQSKGVESNIKWDNDEAPTLASGNNSTILIFESPDGTLLYGSVKFAEIIG